MKSNSNISVAKKWQIALVIVLTIIAAMICILAISQRQNNPKSINSMLDSIKSDTSEVYSNSAFIHKPDWRAQATSTAFNKIDGYEYSISGMGAGLWLAFPASDDSVSNKKYIFFKKKEAKNLEEVANFVKSKLIGYGFRTDDQISYNRGEDTCTVLNDPPQLSGSDLGEPSNILEINCFGKSVLEEFAKQVKPFVNEYIKANPGIKASELAVGPLAVKSINGAGVISSSHEAGYDIAELIISTKTDKEIALYYQKDLVWHYITKAKDEFGFKCADMKLDRDARKAMYDQVCLSENGQVKLDTNNRANQ